LRRLTRENVIYQMSPRHEAAVTLDPGERLCVETEDCYGGRLRASRGRLDPIARERETPATGPIDVSEARPGEILRVDVEHITVRDYAVMYIESGTGALGHRVREAEAAVLPIRESHVYVREHLAVLARPTVGLIGTAPLGSEVPTDAPGEHGGSLGCKEIGPGSSVYLPVAVPGAGLALGDLHAVVGDGEVCICGAEVAGEVVLRAAALRSELPTPCVVTDDDILFLGSAETLDECERIVVDKAHGFLSGPVGLAPNDAARLMSLVGQLGVCCAGPPRKTMKFVIPKAVFFGLGRGETLHSMLGGRGG
jgi:amidase